MSLGSRKLKSHALLDALASLCFFASLLFSQTFYTSEAVAQKKLPVRTLDFAWDPVDKAKGYDLQFSRVNAGNALPISFSSTASAFKGELPVGQYNLKIRTLDSRGVPGAWSGAIPVALKLPIVEGAAPNAGAAIQSTDNEDEKVNLAWKPLGEGVLYTVTVTNSKGKKVVEETVDDPELKVKLSVAQSYQWRVIAKLDDGFKGEEWSEGREFSLLGAELEIPEIKTKYTKEKPTIKWSRPKYAMAYQLEVSLKTGEKEWKEIIKEDEYRRSDVKIPKDWLPGTYRVKTVALANLRAPSKAMQYDFEIESPKVVEETLDESVASKGAPKSKPVSPHRIEFAYIYAPVLKSISVSSEAASAAFNVFVSTSNKVSAGYSYKKAWQSLGIIGGFHLTKKNIFEDSSEIESDSQKPVNIDTADFNVIGSYKLMLWSMGIGPALGFQNRSIMLLKADNLVAFEGEKVRISEILAGGTFGLYLRSGTQMELTFFKGALSGAKSTSAYSRTFMSLILSQPLSSKNILLTGGYTYDSASYEYNVGVPVDRYSAKWTGNMLNLGIAYAF